MGYSLKRIVYVPDDALCQMVPLAVFLYEFPTSPRIWILISVIKKVLPIPIYRSRRTPSVVRLSLVRSVRRNAVREFSSKH